MSRTLVLGTVVIAAIFSALCAGRAAALTIYPIDRAEILLGSRFDVKVEFDGIVPEGTVTFTVNGADPVSVFGRRLQFLPKEQGVDASAAILRDVVLSKPGLYLVTASDGTVTRTVTWNVFATQARKAKNVILFIGDGLSMAHRTAARILSKGIVEGKYTGQLAMDSMPRMAMIGTAGADSIITDSANSMSAYTTGHKSSVNALGVYADRTPDTLDDPASRRSPVSSSGSSRWRSGW
jgi:alkaline phosphatase